MTSCFVYVKIIIRSKIYARGLHQALQENFDSGEIYKYFALDLRHSMFYNKHYNKIDDTSEIERDLGAR